MKTSLSAQSNLLFAAFAPTTHATMSALIMDPVFLPVGT